MRCRPYWNLRISMIIRDLVKAKHQRDVFVRECPETPGNTCTSIGSRPIGNICSLYNLTFNLAIKTVNVDLC